MDFLFKREVEIPNSTYPDDFYLYLGSGTVEEASHEMYSVVPEVSVVHICFTLLTLLITVFGLFSAWIKERLYIGEAIIATVYGIALSGFAAGVITPYVWGDPAGSVQSTLTLELTRVVIALSVFAVGVELPKAYVLRHWKSLAMLLGPAMLWGWLVSAAFMYALIPGIDYLAALVIAAATAPTDPILAASVVGKGRYAQEHVPAHLRHILQCESGCNDGAAFPFLYLASFMLLREERSIGDAIGWWIALVLLYQIVLGVVIGAFVGVIARKLMKFCKRNQLIDRESMVAMYVSLAIFVTGVTTLCGSDDLLAAFACGTAFAWDDWFSSSIEDSNFSSIVDLLSNVTVFVYIGGTIPFNEWTQWGLEPWRLVVLAICILLVRRLPSIFLMQKFIPDIKTHREALFAGHFGPMGVGAIFIGTLSVERLPTPNVPPETNLDRLSLVLMPVVYFIVLSSILVHGLTIGFFSLGKTMHKRVHSRVMSMTRSWGDSTMGEPAWMSRVKRIEKGPGGEIIEVSSPDEGSSPTDTDIEKGTLEEKREDGGKLPETIEEEDGHSAVDDEIIESERRSHNVDQQGRTPHERENDENPPHNVLNWDDSDDEGNILPKTHRSRSPHRHHHLFRHASATATSSPSSSGERPQPQRRGSVAAADLRRASLASQRPPAPKRSNTMPEREDVDELVLRRARESPDRFIDDINNKREEHFCKQGEARAWKEGRKIIIDRGDGGEVEVIAIDPDADAVAEVERVPTRHVVSVPQHLIDAERRDGDGEAEDSALRRALHKMAHQKGLTLMTAGLVKHKDDGLTPAERELRRREKLARDAWCRREQHFSNRDDDEEYTWREGNHIVVERADGEVVKVRDLTEEERSAEIERYLAALYALKHPNEAGESQLQRLTTTVKRAAHRSGGNPRAQHAPGSGRGAARPVRPRSGSVIDSMKRYLGGREGASPERQPPPATNANGKAPAPVGGSSTIRFADAARPPRDGAGPSTAAGSSSAPKAPEAAQPKM